MDFGSIMGIIKYYKELLAHKIEKIIQLPIVFAGKEPFVFPVG